MTKLLFILIASTTILLSSCGNFKSQPVTTSDSTVVITDTVVACDTIGKMDSCSKK